MTATFMPRMLNFAQRNLTRYEDQYSISFIPFFFYSLLSSLLCFMLHIMSSMFNVINTGDKYYLLIIHPPNKNSLTHSSNLSSVSQRNASIANPYAPKILLVNVNTCSSVPITSVL